MNKKRKTDEIEKLTALDDDSVEEIAEVCPFLDESHKNRLYALCEKKLNADKNEKKSVLTENHDTEYILMKSKKKPFFRRLFFTIAASFALIVGVTALTLSAKYAMHRSFKTETKDKSGNKTLCEISIESNDCAENNADEISERLVVNGFNVYNFPEYLAFLQGIPKNKNFYKYTAADSYGAINFSLKDLNNDKMPEMLIYNYDTLIGIYVDTEDSSVAEPLFDMDSSPLLSLCEFDVIRYKSSDEPQTEIYYKYIGGKELNVIYGMQSFYYKTFNNGELYEDGSEYAYYAVTKDRLPDEGHGWDGERYSFPDEAYRISESDFENTRNKFSEISIDHIAALPLYEIIPETENVSK
ncbi:MAG: hypothetical protein J6B75_00970 [Ruminococcus sp.]|nr:hypothetical protein [Ruminococcus sp.]